ncbi:hypothetical protein SAMN04515673_106167 [Poseidonocella sedimentorum]|uniref:YgjP-like metallopeptidase domain-containing protein n=2 Tax=Poseidonocella sedimentorum TaxID=871652 RepID=A0A1I6E0B6_9RHOB|nr:hypothetical protein SAMN04515673_106167 [Poseidonocella sedimentorum]
MRRRVTATVPAGVSERAAVAFAEEKADWIRKHLGACPEPVVVTLGSALPVEGHFRRVVPGQGRRVVLGPESLAVPGAAEQVGARVAGFLRERARARLDVAARRYAAQLDRRVARLTLRDPKSRWGSCSSTGNLMFSWRLILAPPEVLDYVAAHEAAHLVHMDHSARFWDTVAGICDMEAPRTWLKREGETLHRYEFTRAER